MIWPLIAVDPGCVCQCVGSSAVWGWTLSLQPSEDNCGDSLLCPWVMDAAVWPYPLHIHCCSGGPTYCSGEWFSSDFFMLFHWTETMTTVWELTSEMFIATAEHSYILVSRLRPHPSPQIYCIYIEIFGSDEQTSWTPSQSLHVDVGVVERLKERHQYCHKAAVVVTGRRRKFCRLHRLLNWEGVYNRWLRRMRYEVLV